MVQVSENKETEDSSDTFFYEVIALKRYIKIRDGFVVVGVGYLIKVNRNSEEVDNEINTKK